MTLASLIKNVKQYKLINELIYKKQNEKKIDEIDEINNTNNETNINNKIHFFELF